MSDYTIDFLVEAKKGLNYVFDTPTVFHCNHYNRSHQMLIEDPAYINSASIMMKSAAETIKLQTMNYLETLDDPSFEDALEFGRQLFAWGGYGELDFSNFDEDGGEIVSPYSHQGLALQINPGERDKPGEFFDRGFLAGIISAGAEFDGNGFEDGVTIDQLSSISMGDDKCRYSVTPNGDFEWFELMERVNNDVEHKDAPEPTYETNVDRETVLGRLAELELVGNEHGLIPQFGVMLTRGYSDYYNKSVARFVNGIIDKFGSHEIANQMIPETGHLCGYFTFGQIMQSQEWDAVIGSMAQTREDQLVGAISVLLEALGWGQWRIQELDPGERLVIRGYNTYESRSFYEWFGEMDYPVEWVDAGVASVLMSLLYHEDLTEGVEISDEKYRESFANNDIFESEQTASEAMGDDYTEIVTTRVQ